MCYADGFSIKRGIKSEIPDAAFDPENRNRLRLSHGHFVSSSFAVGEDKLAPQAAEGIDWGTLSVELGQLVSNFRFLELC